MNHQEFNKAINEAIALAGDNDGNWNLRFIIELNRRGLVLLPAEKVDPLIDHLFAPNPVSNELPTWNKAVIIPRP